MKYQEAYKKAVQSNFAAYCYHVHEGDWKPTPFHKYLCRTVQDFIEEKTEDPYNILIISTPPQVGKLIADSTPVLTKYGWKCHGDLEVGDYVLNHKGDFVKVTHIHPKNYADHNFWGIS